MFNFKLLKDEKINLVSNDSLLQLSNCVENVSVVITNKRLLIFNYPKDIESFRVGRMIDTFNSNKMEQIFEIEIAKIKQIITNKDFDKYILEDNNYFYLHDNIIRNYFKDKIRMNNS